jgi:hypothetical protein
VRRVETEEDLGTGAQLGFAEPVERRIDRLEKLVYAAGIVLDNTCVPRPTAAAKTTKIEN